MKVVVTGGLGFIGSYLVESLVQRGDSTIVIDDSSHGRVENLESIRQASRLEIFKQDIRNSERIGKAVADADAVVHLAAITSVRRSIENPSFTNDVNVKGTLKVLNACVEASVKRFVFVSSAAIYGDGESPVKESASLGPLSPYAATKVAGEESCLEYSKDHGMPTVILRPFNVYGPRMEGGTYAGVMVKFARAVMEGLPLVVYGDGLQTRDFVHIKDMVGALLLALSYPNPKGDVFNIGTGVGTSINELAHIFIESSGSMLEIIHKPVRNGEVRHSVADLEKSKRRLGYEPKVAVKSGVMEYIEWLDAHRAELKHL